MVLRNVSLVCAVVDNCVVGMEGLAPPLPKRKTMVLWRKQEFMSAVSHSRQVCCVLQQTCLLCDTADSVCCVTQQTMPAVSHSRHWVCVTQQTLSAVAHSRHCCVTQQTVSAVSHGEHCLLCHTADIVCCEPLPQQPNAKQWFCVAGGGGKPPHLRHKTLVQPVQDLHYANFWFCVAGGKGTHAPPLLRHKTTSLCRNQSSGAKLIICYGMNHLSWISTPALC